MEFIINAQKVVAKGTEEKTKKETGKTYTLRTILFEDKQGKRESLAVFNKDLYMIAEEGKTYDLHCRKNYSYIELYDLKETK